MRHSPWFSLAIHVTTRYLCLFCQVFGFTKVLLGLWIIQVWVHNLKYTGSSLGSGLIADIEEHNWVPIGMINGRAYHCVISAVLTGKHCQHRAGQATFDARNHYRRASLLLLVSIVEGGNEHTRTCYCTTKECCVALIY